MAGSEKMGFGKFEQPLRKSMHAADSPPEPFLASSRVNKNDPRLQILRDLSAATSSKHREDQRMEICAPGHDPARGKSGSSGNCAEMSRGVGITIDKQMIDSATEGKNGRRVESPAQSRIQSKPISK